MSPVLAAALLFFFAGTAEAGPQKFLGFRPECDSLGEVESRVQSCTENKYAVESAKDCYRQTMRAWQEAPKDLKPVLSMSYMRKDAKQEETYARAQSDYQESMRKLRDMINLTDRNTELVASYAEAMREDPNKEVDCYTNAFKQMQEIVDRMEDKIDEGLRAEGESSGLKGISQVRDQKVDSSSRDGLVGKESKRGRLVPTPSSHTKFRDRESEVSGLTDAEKSAVKKLPSSAPPNANIHKAMKNENDSAWVDTFLDNHK